MTVDEPWETPTLARMSRSRQASDTGLTLGACHQEPGLEDQGDPARVSRGEGRDRRSTTPRHSVTLVRINGFAHVEAGSRSRGIGNSGNRTERGRPWVEKRTRKGREDTACGTTVILGTTGHFLTSAGHNRNFSIHED